MARDKAYCNRVLALLKRHYPTGMRTSLDHATPFELLVATILSAQSQDKQVNRVTARMFKRFSKPSDYAKLRPRDLYRYIGSLGLFRGKSRNIISSAKLIERRFNGAVPTDMDELVSLPGVGRKTANVVLSSAFGIHEGIAIDTHCITVSNRLGLAHTRDPLKIEQRLMLLFDRKEWANVSHLFIALGRDTCTAREKRCDRCVLRGICPSSTAR